jgi:hypothetical protein
MPHSYILVAVDSKYVTSAADNESHHAMQALVNVYEGASIRCTQGCDTAYTFGFNEVYYWQIASLELCC